MLKLTVPLEAQQKDSTCWHASALMIWRYWQGQSGRAGPMHSLSDKWVNNETITPQEFVNLARNVGLQALPTADDHTANALESHLKDHGPLWCAGYWYGPGHIIVLTGVDGGTIHLNDPDGGRAKTGSISWFNSKLAKQLPGCMMFKDPNRY